MIQRIQSIYLLLAGIFPAITFFAPILHLTQNNELGLTMYSLGYKAVLCPEMEGVKLPALIVLTSTIILLSLFTIFRYKNRSSQIRLINITVLCSVAWYVAFAFHAYSIMNQTGMHLSFDVCSLFPLLGIAALLLARHAIRRDEKLIRAADRIR